MAALGQDIYLKCIGYLEQDITDLLCIFKGTRKSLNHEKIAHDLITINSRDVWSEVRKVKGRNSKISSNVDGSCDSKEITELFSKKYKDVYNSVPYNCYDMHAIRQPKNLRKPCKASFPPG